MSKRSRSKRGATPSFHTRPYAILKAQNANIGRSGHAQRPLSIEAPTINEAHFFTPRISSRCLRERRKLRRSRAYRRSRSVPGLILAAGFSGHGFRNRPGCGALIPEIATRQAPFVDPSRNLRCPRCSSPNRVCPKPLNSKEITGLTVGRTSFTQGFIKMLRVQGCLALIHTA